MAQKLSMADLDARCGSLATQIKAQDTLLDDLGSKLDRLLQLQTAQTPVRVPSTSTPVPGRKTYILVERATGQVLTAQSEGGETKTHIFWTWQKAKAHQKWVLKDDDESTWITQFASK